jgi:hypothetical protein
MVAVIAVQAVPWAVEQRKAFAPAADRAVAPVPTPEPRDTPPPPPPVLTWRVKPALPTCLTTLVAAVHDLSVAVTELKESFVAARTAPALPAAPERPSSAAPTENTTPALRERQPDPATPAPPTLPTLEVVTAPSSARVLVDGKPIASAAAPLAPGWHTIKASAEHHDDVEVTIEAPACSETLRVRLSLPELDDSEDDDADRAP